MRSRPAIQAWLMVDSRLRRAAVLASAAHLCGAIPSLAHPSPAVRVLPPTQAKDIKIALRLARNLFDNSACAPSCFLCGGRSLEGFGLAKKGLFSKNRKKPDII